MACSPCWLRLHLPNSQCPFWVNLSWVWQGKPRLILSTGTKNRWAPCGHPLYIFTFLHPKVSLWGGKGAKSVWCPQRGEMGRVLPKVIFFRLWLLCGVLALAYLVATTICTIGVDMGLWPPFAPLGGVGQAGGKCGIAPFPNARYLSTPISQRPRYLSRPTELACREDR